ncbi:Hypothetical protein, putative [Bodo saltans]|uniref:F-box domain-containing protein n=1 Tax=Bodo saltans TaxID=75058 RepID=A0A0S4IHT3_BODSA|nr:Hypothetical protein, putative [Bodo saltans]|eukprot:CUE68804.1 Hypothetical protein, putative [Bodo saltans]
MDPSNTESTGAPGLPSQNHDNEEASDNSAQGCESNGSSVNKRRRGAHGSFRRTSQTSENFVKGEGESSTTDEEDEGDDEILIQRRGPLRGGLRVDDVAAAIAVATACSNPAAPEADESDDDDDFDDDEEFDEDDDEFDDDDEEYDDDDDEEESEDDDEEDDGGGFAMNNTRAIYRAAARLNNAITARNGAAGRPHHPHPPKSRRWFRAGEPAAETRDVTQLLKQRQQSEEVVVACGGSPCSTTCTLTRLPLDAFHNVLMFLFTKDIIRSISQINRHFYHFCRSRVLWRMLTLRCFPTLGRCLEDYATLVLRRKAALPTPAVTSSPQSPQQACGESVTPAAAPMLLPPPRNLRDVNGDDLGLRTDEICGTCYIANCVMDRLVVHNLPSICTAPGPYQLASNGGKLATVTQCALVKAIRWEDAYHNLPYLTRLLVCDQRNNRIKRLRMDGTVLNTYDENNNVEIATPSGITLLNDGNVAITEFGLSTVAILDLNSFTPKVIRRFEVGYLPRGMATLPDGNILVCMFGESLLKIFSPSTGECVFTVPMRFSGPSGVAVLDEGRVAVSECNGNRVAIIRLVPNDGTQVAISQAAQRNGLGGPYIVEPVALHGSGDYNDDEDNFAEPRGVTFLPRDFQGPALAVCDNA